MEQRQAWFARHAVAAAGVPFARCAMRCAPPCNPSGCAPLPREGCSWGAVTDLCGCCSVCAAGEGEPCGGRGGGPGGRCAPGMECVKKAKRQAGQCVCKNDGEVCGSDGKSYGSSCQLRAAGAAVRQVRKGACDQGESPRITIPPKDIWNISGAQVYLSCEVIGVPTPLLTWKKVSSGHRREKVELLPGDRDNLAVQTRGGPEKHEVTGWVLISPLGKEEGGEYECHAANAKGEAVAMATIHVVESLKDIPTPSLGMKQAHRPDRGPMK
uniref:Insulin-like growth factor binding protein 7 n=1 Tax=Erpetoichthys calabaricus TaxID=27687 RepID=A0A8C4TQB2_ERPCA